MKQGAVVCAAGAFFPALHVLVAPARAQPDYSLEDRMECRAVMPFRSCSRSIDKTPSDALGIVGKVVGSKNLSRWRIRLTVDVTRASASVSKSVEVDVFGCYHWSVTVGDEITAIVGTEADPRHGAYQLHASCNT